jgi:hypothetical protein
MNDRELLEMAAKAAGIHIDKSPCNGGGIGNTGFDMAGNAVLDWHNYKTWNPLTNDGDALRLAVDLSLAVFTGGVGCVSVSGWIVCGVDAKPIGLTEHYGSSDKYAATRRAIVLAAAEIGRRKK